MKRRMRMIASGREVTLQMKVKTTTYVGRTNESSGIGYFTLYRYFQGGHQTQKKIFLNAVNSSSSL